MPNPTMAAYDRAANQRARRAILWRFLIVTAIALSFLIVPMLGAL